jgi:hypothetical protein
MALRSVRTAPPPSAVGGLAQRELQEHMSSGLRRFLILVGVAIVLFFVVTNPTGAADVVQSILAIIGNILSSIATFFRSLF